MVRDPCFERVGLVQEELVGQFGVADRVVPDGRAELVVLHQPVIGVLREGDGGQFEGVHQGQAMQEKGGMQHRQRGLVEGDHVVAEHEARARGDGVEPGSQVRRLALDTRPSPRVRPKGADLPQDRTVLPCRLYVNAQALSAQRTGLVGHQ
jgi:hypothetical protein